jgi:hypothetical protein
MHVTNITAEYLGLTHLCRKFVVAAMKWAGLLCAVELCLASSMM